MRFATDTGGTFTDLIVEEANGALRMYKASTVPSDPVKGVLDVLAVAAADFALPLADFLGRGEMFIHGTTHAINAIITGRTAKTAFLTTKGHPDILVVREGGRMEPFNHTVPYPEPIVPRRLTFEVPGRIASSGQIQTPLDEGEVRRIATKLKAEEVEAIGVCLLWSILNPAHELRVAEIIKEVLPTVQITLSHQLNPMIREYPRAVSTCIDASLKPMMGRYLGALEERLRTAGFNGRVLVLTSQAGMMDAGQLAKMPIHSINSGPSAAPVAGRYYASLESALPDAIVADTGGTTYDVSLVRDGHIPYTKETWIGQPFRSDMTGFPSVDVKSVGAGGGSIAWIDEGGVLHVGPDSAGADPGPACYKRGGRKATVTDASLVLGYIDPAYFLGGAMQLDAASAHRVIADIAKPLNMTVEEAAAAILDVATENMVQAIADITISRGIDPANACLIGGGGAAGLNSVWIARRLGSPQLVIPTTGAALSAAGALITDIGTEVRRMQFAVSDKFDLRDVKAVLTDLETQCRSYAQKYGQDALKQKIEFAVEARYPSQVWEIELPIDIESAAALTNVDNLVAAFHSLHQRIYAVSDTQSPVEFVTWIAKVRCTVKEGIQAVSTKQSRQSKNTKRISYFSGHGAVETAIHFMDDLPLNQTLPGPAIVESPFTTVVIPPDARFSRSRHGNLIIHP